MHKQIFYFAVLCALLLLSAGCSSKSESRNTAQNSTLPDPGAPASTNPLVGRIWRIPNSPYGAAAGSIYVFLPNGTLLETSCVETYRVATWTADKNDPRRVHVVEDQRPAFDASVLQSGADTLQLRQTLSLGNRETRDLTLTAIDKEFVCPDMKK